jgi:hypothetical protein
MRFNPGTIYFVRESIDSQGALSGSVKIGLVEDPRTAYERLAEHQTGNPRRLNLDPDQLVRTDAVKYVESLLHKTYAPNRISGEWFHFENEEAIAKAVEEARKYAKSVGDKMPDLAKAKHLAFVVSAGDPRPATPELVSLGNDLAITKLTIAAYNKLLSSLDTIFGTIIDEEGPEALDGIYKVIDVIPDPAFSVTEFKKAYKTKDPELIAKCTIEEPKFEEDFDLLVELSEGNLPESVRDYVASTELEIEKAQASRDYFRLNELKLEITRLKAPYEWLEVSKEAEIKVFCGTAPGIEGVCDWVRKVGSSKKFMGGILREVNPDLYDEFVLPRKPTQRRIFLGYKS